MLNKTIKGSDFDNIFTEVIHSESLGLINPEQLRLFHLNVMNNEFVSDDLQAFIRKNVGRYVFSRAKLEQFKINDDLESIGLEAMAVMQKNGRPGQQNTGNSLGEILLYAFLEQILDAPKIMSKVELFSTTNTQSSKCDGIHLLSLGGYGQPYYQLVFGSSSVVGDMRDAIDQASSMLSVGFPHFLYRLFLSNVSISFIISSSVAQSAPLFSARVNIR